jgi:hypothetical protein
MPVFQKLLNFNNEFRMLPNNPIIINDLPNTTEEDKEKISKLIMVSFSSDMITLLPSCDCKQTKGEVNNDRVTICPNCKTPVTSVIKDEIVSAIWFRKPNGVNRLISPIIWIMLKSKFTKSGFNIIQWLTDTTYKVDVKQPLVINKIIESGLQRGYNNFVDNFESIMRYLFSLKEFKPDKKNRDQTNYLYDLIMNNLDHVFSDYLPLINKTLLIIEKTVVGIYVDKIVIDAIDAIQMLVSIDKSFHNQNVRVKENRTVKALAKLCDFYENYFKKNLSPKPGQFRKHVFGTRTNFSFRAVVSSLTDTHEYNEVNVPWGIGITSFRPHLINKLKKLGMDGNAATGLLLTHVEKYHPLLDRLLKELISEAKDGILYILVQRNPSLKQGSMQRVKITKFKTDPEDHTVSLSILIIKSMNCDFDKRVFN